MATNLFGAPGAPCLLVYTKISNGGFKNVTGYYEFLCNLLNKNNFKMNVLSVK